MGCNASVPARASNNQPEPRKQDESMSLSPDPSSAPALPASHALGSSSTQGELETDPQSPVELDASGLESLKIKDDQAWKGDVRPRSAMKHGGGTAPSHHAAFVESEAITDRTPSGKSLSRKVSFQVKGLAAPSAVDDGHNHNAKKFRFGDDMSMKKIVDNLYESVLGKDELKTFFEGVDMEKLKNQQEALMLLVFGGRELLESELPGLHADLRAIHLHLIHRGLTYDHWEAFAASFYATLDTIHPPLSPEIRAKAIEYMQSTKVHFRPIEPGEWPPKNPYQGASACPYGGAFKHSSSKASSVVSDLDAPMEAAEQEELEQEARAASATLAVSFPVGPVPLRHVEART